MTGKKEGDKQSSVLARTYLRFGGVIPKTILRYFEMKLAHSGIEMEPKIWAGERFLLAICTGIITLMLYMTIYDPIASIITIVIAISSFIFGFLGVVIIFYLLLYFRITNRTSMVEKILPDFLLLTVSNLRAGMSPFAAFTHAARPEFGPLHYEVKMSAAKAGGRTTILDVLCEISAKFDSQIFKRTVNLFAKGIKSGGQLAKLLGSSADEVRHIQDLRSELVTATRTYTIFLGFIIVIVMPFLLSVSTHFITMFVAIQAESSAGASEVLGNAPTLQGKIKITPDQMVQVSIGTLTLTCLLVSGLMGIIGRGKALYGIKYFPILAIGSVIFFFLAKTVVGSMLSGFFGG